MHILDLVQNALTAEAKTIEITCICQNDQMTLRVADDGVGMDKEVLQAVEDGFFSTKSKRSVGLGIPFLRQAAEQCDGSFAIDSTPGAGTTVTATFRRDHIDLPPFGNLAGTFLSILTTGADHHIKIHYNCDDNQLTLDTEEIEHILGGVPINHPKVVAFLKHYIAERLGGDDETRGSTQD